MRITYTIRKPRLATWMYPSNNRASNGKDDAGLAKLNTSLDDRDVNMQKKTGSAT